MEKVFKIRCSAIGKIMGAMGLTEAQQKKLNELEARQNDSTAKPLTDIMKKELSELKAAAENPTLPQTAKTYLHEWYANDKEEIYSKYMEKGINVEPELIDFAADVLGFGLAEKNTERLEDDYFTGECDVNLPSCIIDVKASWNRKTLHQQVIEGLDKEYAMQLKGYCHLYKKDKAILFFGLMNTPETNYSEEIIYEDMPINERWIAYNISAEPEFIESVKKRVLMCREYLEKYDALIKSKLGHIQ